jgi:phasin family protein
MFGQFSEQMKKSSQPVNELLAANVKAIETVTKQQTQFFSGLVEDSVKLMQTVAQQTEVQGVLAAQSVYAESVRERLTSNSKVTYNTVSSVSKQYTDALESGIAAVTEAAKENVSTAVVQGQPVKAASAKASSVKAPLVKAAPAKKTASKTASTKTSKAVAKPAVEAAKTTTVKQTAKAATKTNPASKTIAQEPVTKATPAPKTAAKPVATLSAEEVKAPAKIKTTDVKATPEKQTEVETKA